MGYSRLLDRLLNKCSHNHLSLTGKPTTIAGYGITDAFDNTDFDTRLATKDTDDVAEETNKFILHRC